MGAASSREEGDGGHRPSRQRVTLGSRGSDLARAQTRQVEEALRAARPELQIETKTIVTLGDEGSKSEPVDRRAGRKGLFTREIERALRAVEIDVAVHSAKDLPSDADATLEVRAALARARIEDVLVTRQRVGFASLPGNAVVATGSVRRQHQLRLAKPGLQIPDLRGNVPTRLRKLIASEWDGIVLARAGLDRLGFKTNDGQIEFEGVKLFVESLARKEFLPAGGQGVIALQVRAGDEATKRIVDAVNHRETLLCLRAEREFLRLLQGDCDSPVGVLATLNTGHLMQVRALVFAPGETEPRTAETSGDVRELTPEAIAAILMEKLNGR